MVQRKSKEKYISKLDGKEFNSEEELLSYLKETYMEKESDKIAEGEEYKQELERVGVLSEITFELVKGDDKKYGVYLYEGIVKGFESSGKVKFYLTLDEVLEDSYDMDSSEYSEEDWERKDKGEVKEYHSKILQFCAVEDAIGYFTHKNNQLRNAKEAINTEKESYRFRKYIDDDDLEINGEVRWDMIKDFEDRAMYVPYKSYMKLEVKIRGTRQKESLLLDTSLHNSVEIKNWFMYNFNK